MGSNGHLPLLTKKRDCFGVGVHLPEGMQSNFSFPVWGWECPWGNLSDSFQADKGRFKMGKIEIGLLHVLNYGHEKLTGKITKGLKLEPLEEGLVSATNSAK